MHSKWSTCLFVLSLVFLFLAVVQLLRIDLKDSSSLTSSENSWGSLFFLFAIATIAAAAHRVAEWRRHLSVE
ncbi:MAG TPA: hypothetical protein VMT71_09105 [Syntrophorhabdales bacterium]|nr:hypothetical protein [Syntrophorhabdales bacterium]